MAHFFTSTSRDAKTVHCCNHCGQRRGDVEHAPAAGRKMHASDGQKIDAVDGVRLVRGVAAGNRCGKEEEGTSRVHSCVQRSRKIQGPPVAARVVGSARHLGEGGPHLACVSLANDLRMSTLALPPPPNIRVFDRGLKG